MGAIWQCQKSWLSCVVDPNTRLVAKAMAHTPQSLPFVCCWQGAYSSFWKLSANRSLTWTSTSCNYDNVMRRTIKKFDCSRGTSYWADTHPVILSCMHCSTHWCTNTTRSMSKNADPLAWFCVSFSICNISSLDKQISTLKHFFSKSVYDSFKFSSSKRSGIVGILLLCDTNYKLARVRLDEAQSHWFNSWFV